jgi:hypothetical protein
MDTMKWHRGNAQLVSKSTPNAHNVITKACVLDVLVAISQMLMANAMPALLTVLSAKTKIYAFNAKLAIT